MEFNACFEMRGSIAFHDKDFFKKGGAIPVLSIFTGVARIVTAVALIALNAVAFAFNALLAIGDVLFVHSDEQRAAWRMMSNLGVIGYNIIQIAHGALDIVPIVGNAPYWIEAACRTPDMVEVEHYG